MIGILQCGEAPAPLTPVHGSYAAMVRRLLGPARDSVTFDVTRGVLPDRVDECDAYVLTGSPAGVYDDLPWIAPLLGFLQQAKGRARLVGICFGHQALAQALGGRVTKAPAGWGIGLHRYAVTARAPWMDQPATEGAASVLAPASHQDQVVDCPPGARVVLASAFTPFAGLDYGDAISVQFHPEFTQDFAIALIGQRRDRYGPGAAAAIASYGGPDDTARVAGWIGRFLDAQPATTTPASTRAANAAAS